MSPATSHPEGTDGPSGDGDPEGPSGGGAEPALDPLAWPGPDPATPIGSGPGSTTGSGLDIGTGSELASTAGVGAAVGFGAGQAGRTGAGGVRRSFGVGALAVLVMILLGIPFGLVWAAVAPGVPVVQTENGALLTEPQPEEFIAADGWFSLLGFGLGVLTAVVLWLVLRRYRGPVGMLAVVLGMIGAAVLAWQLGRQIGLSGYERLLETAPVGETFRKPPDLHGGQFELLLGFIPRIQDLLVPAFGAAVAYTLLAGWSRYPGLRPEAEPVATPVSWDLPAPPAPPAAPAPPGPDATAPPRD